jgi:hypothetical protein
MQDGRWRGEQAGYFYCDDSENQVKAWFWCKRHEGTMGMEAAVRLSKWLFPFEEHIIKLKREGEDKIMAMAVPHTQKKALLKAWREGQGITGSAGMGTNV